MNRKNLSILFLVLLLLVSGKTFSQNEVFEDGEELYYEVYYSFINIGWVKFNTKSVATNTYLCTAVMKSNEGLPFVTVSFEFATEITVKDNAVRPLRFTSKEYKDNKVSILTYNFKYDSNIVDIKKTGYNNEIEFERRMTIHSVFQDGLSIFYYARYNSFKKESKYVPVLINQDSSGLDINFSTAKEQIDIGEVDYPISSVYIDGVSYFKAVFGHTGEFSGWFSNDKARIPLKSKLNVKIGKVTLELKSWKRKKWTPPKYN